VYHLVGVDLGLPCMECDIHVPFLERSLTWMMRRLAAPKKKFRHELIMVYGHMLIKQLELARTFFERGEMTFGIFPVFRPSAS